MAPKRNKQPTTKHHQPNNQRSPTHHRPSSHSSSGAGNYQSDGNSSNDNSGSMNSNNTYSGRTLEASSNTTTPRNFNSNKTSSLKRTTSNSSIASSDSEGIGHNDGSNNNNNNRSNTVKHHNSGGSNSSKPHRANTPGSNLPTSTGQGSSNSSSPTSSPNPGNKRKTNIPPPLDTSNLNHTNKRQLSSELVKVDLPWSVLQAKNPSFKAATRGFHTCTVVDDKLYIIGGDNRQTEFNDVCIFDMKTHFWIKLSEKSYLPAPRTGHSTVLYQDKLYLFGGRYKGFYTADLFVYDLKENVWQKENIGKKKLVARAAHSCCVVDSKMYIFGGITSYQGMDGKMNSDYLNILQTYDIPQKKWRVIKPKGQAPSPRAGHGCCVVGRDIYIFGGRQGTIVLDDMYKFNVDSEKWSRIIFKGDTIPDARAGHTMNAFAGSKLIVVGGSNWEKYFSEVYVFDIPSKVWVKCGFAGIIPVGRFWHTTVVYEEELIVIGGGNSELVEGITVANLKPLLSLTEAVSLTPLTSISPMPLPDIPQPPKPTTMKIKAVHKGDMRIFTKVPVDISFSELKQYLYGQYGFPVVMKYVELNDEKDEITILSDEELQEAVRAYAEFNKNLRLEISEEKSDSSDKVEEDSLILQQGTDIKWQRGETIGRGAYSEVVKGFNLDTGGWMAVKIIDIYRYDPDKVEKEIANEINLMKDLHHENIVRYIAAEFNKKRTKLFIYLELVEGGSIDAIVKELGPLAESVVRNYTRQILFGLKYLHDKGIIHRDIKGANILVDGSGTVKLVDFGHSKKLTDNHQTYSVKGTPMWMAPEVIREQKYSKASDIWSVACTVVEMIIGGLPYPDMEKRDANYVMIRIAEGKTPQIPEHLSEEGKLFLKKCFQQNPDVRPSVDDLLKEPFMAKLRYDGTSKLVDSDEDIDDLWNSDDDYSEIDDHDHDDDEDDDDDVPTSKDNKGKGPMTPELDYHEEEDEEEEEDIIEEEDEEDSEDEEAYDSEQEETTDDDSLPQAEDRFAQSISQQLRNINANNPANALNYTPPTISTSTISKQQTPDASSKVPRGVQRPNLNLNPYAFQSITLNSTASTPVTTPLTSRFGLGSSSSSVAGTSSKTGASSSVAGASSSSSTTRNVAASSSTQTGASYNEVLKFLSKKH
ncbi:hypothetical protein C9374_011256 [Naegleria lovaniensis]|uniref:Protein kinase domain-containing protein n=1 Tax=Naegleria lovaniensis TaxID=51637 RepID=A0AA88H439_NAELO|nr:uncharacterized protein C9374_011256 [Naegleria lovaniensis]KAG2392531.1 hypothetical protein C9374_011256 [Naegleria lovaniensis]